MTNKKRSIVRNNRMNEEFDNSISPFKAYQKALESEHNEELIENLFNIVINSNDHPVITVWALDVEYRVDDCVGKILDSINSGNKESIECAVRWLLDSHTVKWDAYKYDNTMMSAILNNKVQVLDNYYYIFRILMWNENKANNMISYPPDINAKYIIGVKKKILELGTFEDLRDYLIRFSYDTFNGDNVNWDNMRKEFYSDLPAEYHLGIML